jgi:DNA-binding NarL/FixJ family response regulator
MRTSPRTLTLLCTLTMNDDGDLTPEVTRRWASGHLLKKSAESELVKAITGVLKDKSYINSKGAQQSLNRFVSDSRNGRDKELTPRQRQVLRFLVEGRTMKETGDFLHLTSRTIAFHKYKIMEDFGLKTNPDLVKFAIRERVISPP